MGDRLELIVPHCDPVVNLYDQMYGIRNDRVEVVWPVTARGTVAVAKGRGRVKGSVPEKAMRYVFPTVLALALASMPGLASAQTFDAGVKGGASFTDIPHFGEDLEEGPTTRKYRLGAALGGFVAIGLADVIAFQPELLWVQKGLESKPFLGATLDVNLDYLEVPLLVRLGPSSGQGFHVLAGPSINFLTSARASVEGEFGEDEDIKDDTESIDIGLVLGLGYYGRLLLFEGRYEEGLRNVAKSTDNDESLRNRAFMLLMGVRFGR